ncbi:DUF3267 domain-containing protein [Pseudactinotalea terrae]|uniref:DUF3267 domain-containing protein n=1 Tax=Pseudactinotalea terrae TaxID=1743262 RepID=UPI0019D4F66F|nr:DUF3267 domain-containing protein [Pseudactinotalea terrae]
MTLDLKEDRRAAGRVQVIFASIAAGFVAAAVLLDLPLESGWSTVTILAVTLVACVTYMWLHEATHGLLITALSGARSHYAVRLPYLTTGNQAFVSRRAFVVAALGPLALWGMVLLAAFTVAPSDAFLTLYVLSALNVAGSAGDLYQAAQVRRLPGTALIRDDGSTTTVLVPMHERSTPTMDVTIVYESAWGNTKAVAEAVAAGAATRAGVDVTVLDVDAAPQADTLDTQLLVVGAPTHAFGLSRPQTREDAARRGGHASDSGLREWIEAAAEIQSPVAAFDTHVRHPNLPGAASKKAAKLLRRHGATLLVEPESFYVEGTRARCSPMSSTVHGRGAPTSPTGCRRRHRRCTDLSFYLSCRSRGPTPSGISPWRCGA